MVECKNCGSDECVCNGLARGKQRFLCKKCNYNFVLGDDRTNDKIKAKKAMCVLLYSLGKGTFNMLAKIFDTWPSLAYRWILEAGLNIPESEVEGSIMEMEFDEMYHFVGSKKTNFGSSKRLIVAHGKPWPGCSAVVILQPSGDFGKK